MAKRLTIGLVLQGGPGWVGGIEYGKNLAKALLGLAETDRADFNLAFYAPEPIEPALLAGMPAAFHRALRLAPLPPSTWIARRTRQWLRAVGLATDWLRATAAADRVDFLYPFLGSSPARDGFRSSAWIPDFQHRHLPELFSWRERWSRDRTYRKTALVAPRAVVSSEAARRDFLAFYGADPARIDVLTFATVAQPEWFEPDPAGVARRYAVPERFFVVANQFWRHKNHALVFEALRRLRRRGIRPAVVCTGNPHDHRRPGLADEIRRSLDGIEDQVHLVGLIPRQDQIQLLRQAIAIVQPSRFEGWSTVVEDARALGKRIAVSDIPVHREQDPPMARYFPPDDPDRMASILVDWWSDLPLGPVYQEEFAARAANQVQVGAFGRRILSLADPDRAVA